MAVSVSGDVRAAFLRFIDEGQEFRPEASRWPVEARGLRRIAETKWCEYLTRELRDNADTLPDSYCDRLEMPRGSTFGEAARKVWREHAREQHKPVA